MSNTTHAHSRHHDGKASSVSDGLAELKDTVRTGVHDTTESGKRVIHAASNAAMDAATGLGKSARHTRDRIGESISERPFASIAIAAGVGAWLVAAMMWKRR